MISYSPAYGLSKLVQQYWLSFLLAYPRSHGFRPSANSVNIQVLYDPFFFKYLAFFMFHAVTFVVMAATMITTVLIVNGLSFPSFLVYHNTFLPRIPGKQKSPQYSLRQLLLLNKLTCKLLLRISFFLLYYGEFNICYSCGWHLEKKECWPSFRPEWSQLNHLGTRTFLLKFHIYFFKLLVICC